MDTSDEPKKARSKGKIVVSTLQWTSADVKEFQAIWVSMMEKEDKDMDKMGVTLLIWMFTHMPMMRQRFEHFTKLTDDELKGEEKFLAHSHAVMKTLDKLISELNNVGDYDEDVHNLVLTHLFFNPPVTVRYFQEFRNKIHLFVAKVLDCPSDSRECQMWYQFLDGVVQAFNDESSKWNTNTAAPPRRDKSIASTTFRRSYFADRFNEDEQHRCCNIL